jgi:hypothetical protein
VWDWIEQTVQNMSNTVLEKPSDWSLHFPWEKAKTLWNNLASPGVPMYQMVSTIERIKAKDFDMKPADWPQMSANFLAREVRFQSNV